MQHRKNMRTTALYPIPILIEDFFMNHNYAYFSNRSCEYFPCHKGADPDNFNCLFCFCPLYVLGDRCGGQFTYLKNGRKDCSGCIYPHLRQNYNAILARYQELLALMPPPGKTPSKIHGRSLCDRGFLLLSFTSRTVRTDTRTRWKPRPGSSGTAPPERTASPPQPRGP